ncbi:glycosyltransferase family 4 protein [Paralimibaculum aggregatum]|uniref:Glycosyltransferase family 4 protein n=1 Tax=Paralimibaculum aggregatum TaxID=3036245 RepID=A0ABQ6LIA0_9RHOB|nr:glycosyltransferase family 4 protein [Limibaculum sp. NKW23]GMG81382.1 glycosyltransferase family 4 protein [Limibaculum sp. NKW23]
MRILHLTRDLPCPPVTGGQIRDFALIRRIAARHEVRLLAFCETAPDPSDIAAMGGICASAEAMVRPALGPAGLAAHLARHLAKRRPLATAHYVYAPVEARLRAMIAESRPDILQIEHSLLAPYVEAVRRAPEIATVLSLHNVGALQHGRIAALPGPWRRRAAERAKALLMQRWEAEWANRFDLSVTCSEADAEALRAIGARGRIEPVPNGVEFGDAMLAPPRPGPPRLLFVGNMVYLPNIDAARHFAADVLPAVRTALPGAVFTVAGRSPPPDLMDGIDTAGVEIVVDPAEIRPLYEAASAVVVPLRAGGGTRHKIIEAMAFGRPVVSTPLGAEGLAVADGQTLLLAGPAADQAAAVIRLHREPALAARLVTAGRQLAGERYDWDLLADRLEALYRGLSAAG